MILLIDNYDSFTYNLYQILGKFSEVQVRRNDEISLEEVESLNPKAIVISPGPGRPETAGCIIDLIRAQANKRPILGVCLGHQAIGLAFGSQVKRSGKIVHGKKSTIFHRRRGLFQALPLPFDAGRYHSLIIDKETLSPDLIIEAETADGTIMAVRHREYPCYGIQFHPESILTPDGETIIRNFLK